ncbi:MAG TPA: hypothetical protein VHE13_00710 [Opitutus sp.]|nr:hypothetical protein [Opitutus sp.]
MKKLVSLVLAMALPFAAPADDAAKPAPAKNVVSVYSVEPKPGHAADLEAAIAAHAKKYHHGEFAWLVASVMSGPNEGKYLLIEGPASWTAFDDRGDFGAEQMQDYKTTVLPHVASSTPAIYARYHEELSTEVGEVSSKALVLHLELKPGRGGEAYDALKEWQAIYAKLGLPVEVWQTTFSGQASYVVLFRLKHGLKDFDEEWPDFRKAATGLFGPRAYERLQQASADNYSSTWNELIEFKADLGSR